jgi:hypothetical protein
MEGLGDDTTAVPLSRLASGDYHYVQVSILGEGGTGVPVMKRIRMSPVMVTGRY